MGNWGRRGSSPHPNPLRASIEDWSGEGVFERPSPWPLRAPIEDWLGEGSFRGPHPGPLPKGEGSFRGPHPDPLPKGEGSFWNGPHPGLSGHRAKIGRERGVFAALTLTLSGHRSKIGRGEGSFRGPHPDPLPKGEGSFGTALTLTLSQRARVDWWHTLILLAGGEIRRMPPDCV